MIDINKEIAGLQWDKEPKGLYEPIAYTLSAGGKRLRPQLALIAAEIVMNGGLLNGDALENTLPAALALEVFHNFTLLHDDIMDKAPVRRGRPTVHVQWNDNTAILSGDSMLVLAYERMAQCSAEKLPQILSLFTETALEIGEGQQYDMDFEHRNDVREEEYIEMIRLKTSVLLACATKMGALMADADERDAELLYKFGEQFGLAFQLQDDYLDVYGDPAVFGKAIGGDITSNKKTFMLINALNRADERQRAELIHWIGAEKFDRQEKIEAVTRLYNAIGVDRLAQERIAHYFDESRKYLDAVGVSEDRKNALRAYANEMMFRKS